MIIKVKREKHTLLCLLLAAALVSGCAQKHKEGEPDVISSMKINQDETKNARIILFSLLDSLQIMGMPPA